ncbi:MAG TPA: hypothetical protein VF192_17220 [Longimicrobiales bacterium]
MSRRDGSPFRFRAAADAAEVQCRRCLRLRPFADLDRMFWCEECRTAARRLAARFGRIGALAGAVAVALWVGLVVQPASVRLQILYAVAVLVVYRIGRRLAEEVVYGAMRIRNREGARATEGKAPPESR